MKKPTPLIVPMPTIQLPIDHVTRRIHVMDWTYKRLHLLDDYVALGVVEAIEVQRRYWECRRQYGDLAALEHLEQAIENLENAV